MRVLVSAGALDDALRQYNFTDLFSYLTNLFRPQTKGKKKFNFESFSLLSCFVYFHLFIAIIDEIIPIT